MAAQIRQLGNTHNGALPAFGQVLPDETIMSGEVTVEGDAPVRKLNSATLRTLAATRMALFQKFASERLPAEQKWLRNLRQYLGIYDPEIERQLAPSRSRAYPRLTRMKCIAMLSRLMNLMFPGNEDNWDLAASPSPEMDPASVAQAVEAMMQELSGGGAPPPLTQELVEEAVRALAGKQAKMLKALIKDQLLELGGDQTLDWIALNRKIVDSGIKYGIGVLEGPFIRKVQTSGWMVAAPTAPDPTGAPAAPVFEPVEKTIYKPMYEHLSVWDFYPDMSARSLPGEGYFKRKVIGRSALRKLANRNDFFGTQIKQVLSQYQAGNYKPRPFETELRTMGTAIHAENAPNQTSGREKFEIIIWKGPISAQQLLEAGADVPEAMRTDDVDAELWMIDNWIIKAEVNPWRKLGVDVPQVHIFSFDEDDTSPVGQGLPGIVRDSQLSICAATRMALDNASIVCGPQLEVNTALLRADQDLTSISAYKLWYRDDDGPSSQFPAIRELNINGHLAELQNLVRMFLEFAEMETFIGPNTGGDNSRMPSEPMRTAAGASMLRGDAALPFKDIVRNFDSFTQSAMWSLVQFNKVFNPEEAPGGDYDVIPRGATSLIAKEVRGMQIDALSQTLTPNEMDHIDERAFIEAKFASRDMENMLVSEDQARRNKAGRAEEAAKQAEIQARMAEAQIRDINSGAFKNVSQAQKNAAAADGQSVKTALEMLNSEEENANAQGAAGGSSKAS